MVRSYEQTSVLGYWPSAESNVDCYKGTIPYLWCPSDAIASTPSQGGEDVRCSYPGCWGDWVTQFGEESKTRGFFSARGESGSTPQTRRITAARSVAEIVDGLSNTLAISETCTAASDSTYQVKGNIFSTAYAKYSPSECQAHLDPTDPHFFTPGNNKVVGTRGRSFVFGAPGATGFLTAGSPNSLNCRNNSYAHMGWDFGIGSASSYHSGGVNGLLADGSVRFFSETIECGDSTYESEEVGPSHYGVWGAYGSINGGESVSL